MILENCNVKELPLEREVACSEECAAVTQSLMLRRCVLTVCCQTRLQQNTWIAWGDEWKKSFSLEVFELRKCAVKLEV
jgi:hypothetical protein